MKKISQKSDYAFFRRAKHRDAQIFPFFREKEFQGVAGAPPSRRKESMCALKVLQAVVYQ